MAGVRSISSEVMSGSEPGSVVHNGKPSVPPQGSQLTELSNEHSLLSELSSTSTVKEHYEDPPVIQIEVGVASVDGCDVLVIGVLWYMIA